MHSTTQLKNRINITGGGALLQVGHGGASFERDEF